MQTQKNTPLLSRENIHLLFNEVATTYDKINAILSFGIDKYWRKKISTFVPKNSTLTLLDLATGTGDQLFSLIKHRKNITKAVGIDLAGKMLAIAKEKSEKMHLSKKTEFLEASALQIPFEENSFDLLTMSFGIRNVTSISSCFSEMLRVLKPHGKVYILEFSLPKSKLFKFFYLFYLRKVLPSLGKLLSKNNKAYSYLNQTIETFPYGNAFCEKLKESGFSNVKSMPLTFGIVHLYSAEKSI